MVNLRLEMVKSRDQVKFRLELFCFGQRWLRLVSSQSQQFCAAWAGLTGPWVASIIAQPQFPHHSCQLPHAVSTAFIATVRRANSRQQSSPKADSSNKFKQLQPAHKIIQLGHSPRCSSLKVSRCHVCPDCSVKSAQKNTNQQRQRTQDRFETRKKV